jgi:hypothetical protein
MPDDDVDNLDVRFPGWIAQNLLDWSEWLDSRLRKRYGRGGQLFGLAAPGLLAAGTAPPTVTLSGMPTVGSLQIVIMITTAGALGAALFHWSKDGGHTWTPPLVPLDPVTGMPVGPDNGIATASTFVLGTTGLTANFPAGTYGTDAIYRAPTPAPGAILRWLTVLGTWDAYGKRGADQQDPFLVSLKDKRDTVLAEVKEAADSKEGLFDLPTNGSTDSAVKTGGPLFYSESSPFVSADRQEAAGRCEDERGFGTTGGL